MSNVVAQGRGFADAASAGPRLIALSAYARAGKDSVANVLVEEGYTRVAFAEAIYGVVLGMNPLVRVNASAGWGYRVRPVRRLGELVAAHGWDWIKVHCPEGRRLLNVQGAAIRAFDNDFWVNATMSGLDPQGRYVISDCRFPAEAEAVAAAGGLLVRIDRPGVGPARDPLTGQPYLSDIALDDWPVDYALANDGSNLSDLRESTLRMLTRMAAGPASAAAAGAAA